VEISIPQLEKDLCDKRSRTKKRGRGKYIVNTNPNFFTEKKTVCRWGGEILFSRG